MESGGALLRDCVWLGVACLVTCCPGIGWAKAHSLECFHCSLFMHSDARTIFRLLLHSPRGIRQLESCSAFPTKLPTMAMAVDRPAYSPRDIFRGLSRI